MNGAPAGTAQTRRALAASLLAGIERVETGNGFDSLAPTDDLVSVVIPAYSHEQFVAEAIGSVAAQTHRTIEIILVDDQSPDQTFERALGALQAGSLPYCAIKGRHAGMDANLNAGILLSRGSWISCLGSDDAFPPDSFAALLSAARRDSADVAVGSVQDVGINREFKSSRAEVVERLRAFSGEALRKAILEQHGSLMIQGMLISRRVFARVGLFSPELAASDFDYLVRMASLNVTFAFVNVVTCLHRHPRNALSERQIRRSLDSHIAIARRHARTGSEYRLAASTVLCEAGLNYLHYGYHWQATAALLRALCLAPVNAGRFLYRRLAGRLRRA